ncbi:hypothetical protein [Candidatus Odyssella acanthamoebae]|uniref:Uncharacterized protein n=1 Tax=Candidatus Odyssella acanthamoebae TaxID=91604 RepID=A0A077AUJ1_9PROT|nr:hypothetical protein [Candidatus Paracaedibacter acanthamoebae]AIK96061.1 hypothetical protein ID47_03820 [Candidatus Paracaedibacter acanthamoebae]
MKYTLTMLLTLCLPAISMDQDDLQRQIAEYEKLQRQALQKMETDLEQALRESVGGSYSPRGHQRDILPTHTPNPSLENFEDDEILQTALRESLQISQQQTRQPNTFEADALLAQRLYEEEMSSHAPLTTAFQPNSFPTQRRLNPQSSSPIDPASAELIRQIEAEDSYIDSASAELIRQLQSMDLGQTDEREQYDRSVRARFVGVAPVKARNDFNKIKRDILAIYRGHGADVHAGDGFICATASNLLAIAALFDNHLSQASLSIHGENLLQLQERLLQLIAPYSSVLDQYAYQDVNNNIRKNYKEITDIIRSQFARSNREIASYAGGQGTLLWARFLALAAERLNDPHTPEAVKRNIAMIVAEKAVEGMLTQGGCIQGFVNRGFIGLLTILGFDLSDHSESNQFQSH